MGPISLDIAIDAPREAVFDRICDLSRRQSWTDHFVSDLRLERIEASGRGAAARFRAGAPGVEFVETVIDVADRPSTIVEKGQGRAQGPRRACAPTGSSAAARGRRPR